MTTPSSFLSPNPHPHPPPHPSLDSSSPEPLYVTVRFSASISDLPIDIPYPETTTAAGLKQLIRTRLPPNLSAHRLRLIYAGRGLEDASPLTVSLKLPPSPARTPRPAEDEESDKGKGKGKEPVRDQPRLYIHCSIGDIVLSENDLAAEAAIASTLLQQEDDDHNDDDDDDGDQESQDESSNLLLKQKRKKKEQLEKQQQQQQQRSQQQQQPTPSTTPAPRGFDRLLTAGFTPAEVTALRSQFMAVQSVSRTPDTMPTGAELRDLEDRWMDEGTTATAAAGAGTAGGGAGFGGDDDGGFGAGSRGAMDDMLWGAVMGFFWPVGCAMWLRREEGVWSWRKGLAVFVGVIVNAAFGAMRIMN